LYLKTSHTLFEEATRKIFEKYKNKEFTKLVVGKFVNKITEFLGGKNY